MYVELPTTSKRSLASTLPPASSAMNLKRAKVNLSEDQLNSLGQSLGNGYLAGSYTTTLNGEAVLSIITRELANTDVIGRPPIDQASDIVASCISEWSKRAYVMISSRRGSTAGWMRCIQLHFVCPLLLKRMLQPILITHSGTSNLASNQPFNLLH